MLFNIDRNNIDKYIYYVIFIQMFKIKDDYQNEYFRTQKIIQSYQ